jgi:uncharacterized protein HemX
MIMSGVVVATAAVVGTGYSIYQGEKMADQQRQANERQASAQAEAKTAAEKQQAVSEQAVNKANAKEADMSSIYAAAADAGKGSGTLLTGPQGSQVADMNLGKSTLLGA